MKKSKRDLEMKHKNRSSQTHSKISLQNLKWERQEMCEREWEVFLKLKMEFWVVLFAMGREVGGSIYRWSSKLAVG
jgi:hypothetical protein